MATGQEPLVRGNAYFKGNLARVEDCGAPLAA